MAAGEWFLHWDNALVHTVTAITDWLAARRVKMIEHPPYLPDLAPTNFFLFLKVKKELAGLTLTRESFKKDWEGAVRTLSAADFAEVFRQWFRRCKKCVNIGGGYVEKT